MSQDVSVLSEQSQMITMREIPVDGGSLLACDAGQLISGIPSARRRTATRSAIRQPSAVFVTTSR